MKKTNVKQKTFIFVVLIMLSVLFNSTTVIQASEKLPDEQLANLYGGCWFWNAYCKINKDDCPKNTSCDQECAPCAFCVPKIGTICDYKKSPWIDPYCDQSYPPCTRQAKNPSNDYTAYGSCLIPNCIPNNWPSDPNDYPNCGDSTYSKCVD